MAIPVSKVAVVGDAGRVVERHGALAERAFYGGAAAFVGATVFAGFWRSFLFHGVVDPPAFPVAPFTPLVLVHGVLFMGWVLLFIVQASLVGAGRRDLHRRLGVVATIWLPLLFGVGTWTSLQSIVRHTDPGFLEPPAWLAVQLIELATFALLAGAAYRARRDLQTHKRLMLLAMIQLLAPAIARWPLPGTAFVAGMPTSFFLFADLAILPLVAWDIKTLGRVHRATLWGGLVLVLSYPASLAIGATSAWTALVDAVLQSVA